MKLKIDKNFKNLQPSLDENVSAAPDPQKNKKKLRKYNMRAGLAPIRTDEDGVALTSDGRVNQGVLSNGSKGPSSASQSGTGDASSSLGGGMGESLEVKKESWLMEAEYSNWVVVSVEEDKNRYYTFDTEFTAKSIYEDCKTRKETKATFLIKEKKIKKASGKKDLVEHFAKDKLPKILEAVAENIDTTPAGYFENANGSRGLSENLKTIKLILKEDYAEDNHVLSKYRNEPWYMKVSNEQIKTLDKIKNESLSLKETSIKKIYLGSKESTGYNLNIDFSVKGESATYIIDSYGRIKKEAVDGNRQRVDIENSRQNRRLVYESKNLKESALDSVKGLQRQIRLSKSDQELISIKKELDRLPLDMDILEELYNLINTRLERK